MSLMPVRLAVGFRPSRIQIDSSFEVIEYLIPGSRQSSRPATSAWDTSGELHLVPLRPAASCRERHCTRANSFPCAEQFPAGASQPWRRPTEGFPAALRATLRTSAGSTGPAPWSRNRSEIDLGAAMLRLRDDFRAGAQALVAELGRCHAQAIDVTRRQTGGAREADVESVEIGTFARQFPLLSIEPMSPTPQPRVFLCIARKVFSTTHS